MASRAVSGAAASRRLCTEICAPGAGRVASEPPRLREGIRDAVEAVRTERRMHGAYWADEKRVLSAGYNAIWTPSSGSGCAYCW